MTDAGSSAATTEAWTPPGATQRKAILDRTKSIAIVGASSNPSRSSNFVLTYCFINSSQYAQRV